MVAARGCRGMVTKTRPSSPRTKTVSASTRRNQKTTAGYVQASFKHEKWDGNLGVRFVHTISRRMARGVSSSVLAGQLRSPHSPGPPTSRSRTAARPRRPAATATTTCCRASTCATRRRTTSTCGSPWPRVSARPEFAQLLPSITVTPRRATSSWCLRAAASGSTTPGDCVSGYNGFAGNPDLEPMDAMNYD